MRKTRWISSLILPLMLVAAFGTAQAQGKGKGSDKKADKGQAKGAAKQGNQGKAAKAVAKSDKSAKSEKSEKSEKSDHKVDKPAKVKIAAAPRDLVRGRSQPKAKEIRESGGTVVRSDYHAFAASNKHGQKLVGRAISRASRRGVSDDAFVITPVGNRVHVLNRQGALLLDLDDDRDVGTWRVVNARETGKKDAPSFCRSGAGHPVWGRQWCIDKGFGLGDDQGVRWGRVIEFDNVVFRSQPTATPLARNVLLDVLGDVVFNRLATQAITLGYVEPLTGRWIGEPTGSRVLLLSSGDRPVAEIVDLNRDNRAEMLVVALRP